MRERIFIVFNGKGALLALFIAVLFFMARFRHDGGGLAWTLGVSLIVAGLVGTIQTNENLRGVLVRGVEIEPVPEGEGIEVRVMLENTSAHNRCGFGVRLAGLKFWRHRARLSHLGPGQQALVSVRLPARARGVQELPPLIVWSQFPLGLCVAWKKFSVKQEIVVYPRPEGVAWKSGQGREEEAGAASDAQGADDVTGHRPYLTGDAPSRVDWRLFARRGELLVRTREGEKGGEVLLRWEDTRFVPGTEARLRQLSRWMSDCVATGAPFRLELGDHRSYSHRQLNLARTALAAFCAEEES